MKIAIFVGFFPTLSETFILSQITGLIDLGHDITIIAGANPKEKNVHKDFYRYDLQSRTHWLPKSKLWRVFKVPVYLCLYFRHVKILLKSLHFKKYGREATSLKLFYTVIALLNRGPFDLIHCQFGTIGRIGQFVRHLGFKPKFITVFHGSDATATVQRFGANYYRGLFKEADILLVVSFSLKKVLIKTGAEPNRILVHHSGIVIDNFKFQPRTFDKKRINLLTIGRFVEKKGLEYSIRAITDLIKRQPEIEFRYHIIGDGPLRERLDQLIRDQGMENSIEMLGGMEQEEIRKWLYQSDIFVLASVTAKNGDKEGIPVSLMEAMATGMPVVSTYHSGIPELIENGVSGFLVPERDASRLTDVLEYMITHPEIWHRIGEAGRRKVEEEHNVRTLNQKLDRLLREIVNETSEKEKVQIPATT